MRLISPISLKVTNRASRQPQWVTNTEQRFLMTEKNGSSRFLNKKQKRERFNVSNISSTGMRLRSRDWDLWNIFWAFFFYVFNNVSNVAQISQNFNVNIYISYYITLLFAVIFIVLYFSCISSTELLYLWKSKWNIPDNSFMPTEDQLVSNKLPFILSSQTQKQPC